MSDMSHLPNVFNGAETFRFEGNGDWKSFLLPRGKSHVGILCVGSGAGGGSGFSAAAATARGGGGGGGSAALVRAIFQREALPDQLFINAALGGLPGAAGALSRVTIRPDTIIQNSILVSGAAAPTAGGNGAAAAVGSAGAAGTVTTTTICGAFSAWALSFVAILGVVGSAGGAVAGGAGTSLSWGTAGLPLIGGAGGGGTTSADFAGGGYFGAGWQPTLAGGLAGSNRGNDGLLFPSPLASLGGTGGGSSNAGVGGAGGDGAMGSGGGGGGAGVTGGAGGRGGPGLVLISCW
jgi:hypothetical protein